MHGVYFLIFRQNTNIKDDNGHEFLINNHGKNKADEWLCQILEKSSFSSIEEQLHYSNLFTELSKTDANNSASNAAYFNSTAKFSDTSCKWNLPYSVSANFLFQQDVVLPTNSINNTSGFSGPPPNQPPPPLPPSVSLLKIKIKQNNVCDGTKNYNNDETTIENNILVNTTIVPKVLIDGEINKNLQTRKSSNSRMSIEYQLLEEIDVPPQSPNSLLNKQAVNITNLKFKNEKDCNSFNSETPIAHSKPFKELTETNKIGNGNITTVVSPPHVLFTINNDPFDVKWSAEILQKSSVRRSNIDI